MADSAELSDSDHLKFETKSNSRQNHQPLLSVEEVNALKESLFRLRQTLKSNHPSQLLFNTLEQGFMAILERSNLIGLSPAFTSSSNASSLTTSQSNSPVMQVSMLNTIVQPSSSPASSASSSTSSYSVTSNSSNSIMAKKAQIELLSENKMVGKDETEKKATDQISVQIINNLNDENENKNSSMKEIINDSTNLTRCSGEGNVKKIISRLMSQTKHPISLANSQQSTMKDTKQEYIKQPEAEITETSSSVVNSLLAIRSDSSSNASGTKNQQDNANTSANNSVASTIATTKFIYYLDKNVTPFMTTINKSIETIRLSDVKEFLKFKSNLNHRFYFKSHDPEFGIVKEEVNIFYLYI